jgi:hypothetical protein
MPLESSNRRVLGNTVYCTPIEYYGWSSAQRSEAEPRPVPVPKPFHARISELHNHAGELRALVGSIQDPGHPFDQLWAAFCIRDSYLSEEAEGKMFFDLTSNLGKYNIAIGSQKPNVEIDFARPMIEWVRIEGCPVVHGFGYLSEAKISLDQIHADARKANDPDKR